MEVIIFIAAVLGIIFAIKSKLSKPKYDQKYYDELENIKQFNKYIELYKKEYFTSYNKSILINKFQQTYNYFSNKMFRKTKELNIVSFNNTFSNLNSLIRSWNEEYILNELEKNKSLFDDIDGKSLDEQQRRAVVVDEMNNLILAGAGSGKTLTLSGKVKYLVDTKNIKPEEILLISFTKKAAEEMMERIANKLNINIESKTFHKLGLDIITEHHKKRFDVAECLDSVIDEYFTNKIIENDNQIINMINFFSYYLNIPKNAEKYKSLGDLYEDEKSADFETLRSKYNREEIIDEQINSHKFNKRTIQGETVKSLEEVQIANFLFLNSVKYDYESLYPFETDDPYKKAYRPDFYLPDYNIYLEHFGFLKMAKFPGCQK